MANLVPEIPTQFGALDSVTFADGYAPTAHVLRELARNGNRLLARGEQLLNIVWDGGSAVAEIPQGGFGGFGLPFWHPILPKIPCPKKPGIIRAKLFVRFFGRLNEEFLLQVATRASPVNHMADNNSVNTLRITGDGGWKAVSLANIPISPTTMEEIEIYLLSEVTTTAPSAGGTPTSGVLEGKRGNFGIYDSAGIWTADDAGTSFAETGCAILIDDSVGQPVMQPRWITNVQSTTVLEFLPGFLNAFEQGMVNGANYRIRELPRWRISNLALYAQDRTG